MEINFPGLMMINNMYSEMQSRIAFLMDLLFKKKIAIKLSPNYVVFTYCEISLLMKGLKDTSLGELGLRKNS
jgi:hypothetical protein